MSRHGVLALGLLLAAAPLRAELVELVNGDRISGKIVARGTKRVRLKTPYGLLAIPLTEIARLVDDDGREEVLTHPPTTPAPPPVPPPPPAGLGVVVTGDSFWQAWDPQSAPADPSLRLLLAIDGSEVVSYLDLDLDPGDLPGAVVNSFLFSPERLFVRGAPGVEVAAPEVGDGEIRLALQAPASLEGQRRLTLAYQVNDGTSARPEWRDVAQAELEVELAAGRRSQVRLEQERGRMEYARRAMRHVETFRLVAREGATP